MHRIIFVCYGNTCRSPMAEYIMRHLLKAAGLADKVRVDSAGCKSSGEPMNAGIRKELAKNNIPFDNRRSKVFTAQSYQQADCIIAMDGGIVGKIKRKVGGDPDKKIRLLIDADGSPLSVANPFNTHNYSKAYSEIYRGCVELLKTFGAGETFINDAADIIPKVNDSPYKRLIAIGDVHAAFDKLQSLWQKLSVEEGDLILFLGDYLYGMGDGDKNVETLHWLIEHARQKNIIFLRGNVDDTYLDCLFDEQGKMFRGFNSRVARGIKTAAIKEPYFPQEIYTFLNNLPLSYQVMVGGRQYFFCHAGINVDKPLNAQTKSYLIDHPRLKSFYRDYADEAVIVVGHKSPKKIFGNPALTMPVKVPRRNIVMLDTGAKEDGLLSAVDLLSGRYWQSETR
ncbi:MAG: metallophosphoesterase [Selenomonadaceae bacterium]|nr:metallophosphoesterase [Selenomonadaceae bacterium]